MLAACGGGSEMGRVVDECDLQNSPHVDVDEAGLFVDGEGDESAGAGIEDLVCLLVALEVPDSVISRMDSTTSLMGVQEASFRGLDLSWTYHPSNGLDFSVVEE